MFVKSFKVTGIYLSLDGSESSMFRNQLLLENSLEEEEIEEDEDLDPFDSDCDSD